MACQTVETHNHDMMTEICFSFYWIHEVTYVFLSHAAYMQIHCTALSFSLSLWVSLWTHRISDLQPRFFIAFFPSYDPIYKFHTLPFRVIVKYDIILLLRTTETTTTTTKNFFWFSGTNLRNCLELLKSVSAALALSGSDSCWVKLLVISADKCEFLECAIAMNSESLLMNSHPHPRYSLLHPLRFSSGFHRACSSSSCQETLGYQYQSLH